MRDDDAITLSALVLAAANALVDGIHAGVVQRGFTDLRPAHGFVFARLAPAGATVSELAVHLGVTRQAAAQLVDELVAKGYVERRRHPNDGRAQLITLTERGWACTRAAEAAATDTVGAWAAIVGEERLRAVRQGLAQVAPAGHLRPTW
ncbi:MAG: MarR family transcriptional regulator [Kitasatospora sp.]|jgi:DNA-binding MarR family transcriptional regulator|nr:MarR family transcriptional regulator [Kitasatospora sp.]